MKRTLFILLLGAAISPAPAAVIVGTDLGYLLDSEEAYYAGRVGLELQNNPGGSHQLEAEIGYTESRVAGGDASLLPVTLNYRFVGEGSGALGYYAGVGAGFARTRVDGASINGPVYFSDESFAAQAFAGIEYRLTPLVALSAGLRYLWIDDVKLTGAHRFEVGDDIAVSVGLRVKF